MGSEQTPDAAAHTHGTRTPSEQPIGNADSWWASRADPGWRLLYRGRFPKAPRMMGNRHLSRRPFKPCPKPNRCQSCRRVPDNYPDGVSCQPKDVRGRPGIPHSWAAYVDVDDCPDDTVPCRCGAPVGGYHHWECDLEVCPWAAEHPDDGEQLLYCPCFQEGES